MSRQIKDWAVIAVNGSATVHLRVWDQDQALVGVFTVNIPQAATKISDCVWSGAGWSNTYLGAEVVSITNGDIYAAPVDTLSALSTTSGEKLVVGFGMGVSGLTPGQSQGEVFRGALVIENRTDDPASPAIGRLWLRTDL